MRAVSTRTIALALALQAAICAVGIARADSRLRYAFKVGDRIVYQRDVEISSLSEDRVLNRYTEQIQLWCLSIDADQSVLLGDIMRVIDGKPGPSRGALLSVNLRGQRKIPTEFITRLGTLDALWEVLPIMSHALDSQASWLTEPDHYNRRWRCEPSPDDSTEQTVCVRFELDASDGVSAALGRGYSGKYWFDIGAGVVSRAESRWTDSETGQAVHSVIRLYKRLSKPESWLALRQAETRFYMRALRSEDRLLGRMESKPVDVDALLSRMDDIWAESIREMDITERSPVRRLAESHRSQIADRAFTLRERARLAHRWLGTTAAHWSLQTADGETLQSDALRDRPVLECFWSAKSLNCLRSFEPLRRMQAAAPEAKLRVICMNVDADLEAARAAVDRCGQGLLHVFSGPPVGGELPAELPIFRLLDRESRVRRVYFGWHPDFAEVLELVAE